MNKSSDIAKLCNEIQEIMEVIIKAQFQKHPRNQRIISMVKLSSVTKRYRPSTMTQCRPRGGSRQE